MSNAVVEQMSEGFRNAIFNLRQTRDVIYRDCATVLAAFAGVPSLQELKQPRRVVGLGVAFLAFVTMLIVAFELSAEVAPESSCPVVQPRRKGLDHGPVALLASARAQKGSAEGSADWSPASKTALQDCMSWAPMRGGLAPLEQLQAQLVCHDTLISVTASEEEAASLQAAFAQRARVALSALRGINRQCEVVHSKMQSLNRVGAATRQPIEAIVALGGLGSFEDSAREGFATLDLLRNLLKKGSHAEQLLEEQRQLQSGFHGCVLKAVREARVIAHAVPLDNPAVRQVQLCKPVMLMGLERLALDAEVSHENSAVSFSAGLLMSEVSTAPDDAPFFGPPLQDSLEWSVDARGLQVPFFMEKSERMLLASMAASSNDERSERSKWIAMNLANHATFLTQQKQYAAAEWRYRASADIAKQSQHLRIAASSYAQLSYFLSLHGGPDEALEAAGQSLQLGEDSLATYMQASLRLASGELRTDEQLQEVGKQLKATAGKLPLESLEEARAETLSKLGHLHRLSESSSTGSLTDCVSYMDASEILICALGWFTDAFA